MKKIKNSPKFLKYEYVKILKPKNWMFLVAILFLVCGIMFWTIFSKVETIIKVGVSCKENVAKCYFSEENLEKIKDFKKVPIYVEGQQFFLNLTEKKAFKISTDDFSYAMHVSNLEKEKWAYIATFKTENLYDKDYVGYIVVEKFSPISFFIK